MGYREKCVRAGLLSLGVAALAWSVTTQHAVSAAGQAGDPRDQARRDRFTPATAVDDEAPPTRRSRYGDAGRGAGGVRQPDQWLQRSGGLRRQSRDLRGSRSHRDGLGPTYNAQSCRECHQNVVTGGASQITEQRTGHLTGGQFFDSQGGSLIASRATHPDAMELVAVQDNIRTFRISTNVARRRFSSRRSPTPRCSGSGVAADSHARRHGRRSGSRGEPDHDRIGRFGWKDPARQPPVVRGRCLSE